jgi:hypothetical protein
VARFDARTNFDFDWGKLKRGGTVRAVGLDLGHGVTEEDLRTDRSDESCAGRCSFYGNASATNSAGNRTVARPSGCRIENRLDARLEC